MDNLLAMTSSPSCCDKISDVNETENNSGELTDKYPFLYTFGGSWSDFNTCTTLKIHGWLIEIEKITIKMQHDIPQRQVMSEWIFVWYLAAQSGRSVPLNRLLLWFLLDPRAFVPQTLAYIVSAHVACITCMSWNAGCCHMSASCLT